MPLADDLRRLGPAPAVRAHALEAAGLAGRRISAVGHDHRGQRDTLRRRLALRVGVRLRRDGLLLGLSRVRSVSVRPPRNSGMTAKTTQSTMAKSAAHNAAPVSRDGAGTF
ncbi:hypothetical protein [Paractinoplanes atraurantiacus]|uniref:Uncharacterized protein n=1 Tax=Paractinoplanes atraurantiacus TaxID=1036182 RepID=A0A285GJJ2_9ACTN|nr:hypothetical protein [Actinoplanes atraurantiacus]SNY23503.1 hypothetical protein SAMN05421748_10251 [Actinoplanes atraurantiacus]